MTLDGVVAVDNSEIHFTGSFEDTLNIPVSGGFSTANLANFISYSCPGNSPYCSDPDYGEFSRLPGSGNLDIVIANGIDPNREPYDYYFRSGGGCSRPFRNVCMGLGCPDTVK